MNLNGDIYGSYKTGAGYVTYSQLMDAFGEWNSTNWIVDIINSIDNATITTEEMKNVHDLGIFPPGGCDCELQRTYTDENGITHDVSKSGENWVYYTWETYGGETVYMPHTVQESDTVEDSDRVGKVGNTCKTYIKFIVSRLQKASDDSYETYTPYIESVQNHWFRDVYFVEKAQNDKGEDIAGFVDYDYQYEVVTGERWTLYETYTNNPDDGELYNPEKYGEFVYYYLKPDGTTGERYKGDDVITGEDPDNESDSETIRVAARTPDGEPLVKKAKTIDDSKFEDLGWKELSNGSFSAYDPDVGEAVPEYQKMYSEEEIAEASDDLEKDAMEKMYIQLAITKVTQTGEGLRTETNPEIKKMFLQNKYFKYDGSQTRAEIIYALRKAAKADGYAGYGAIEDEEILNKSYKLDFSSSEYVSSSLKEDNDEEYKISDYVASVTFNQTSLDAFSMLENTHTLDADYIYKDFKELVVELGYFEKEELTESTPKLLQWIVPDIGSAGFPDRSIDKREGEYGTMVHSKADIDANQKNIIASILAVAPEDTEDPQGAGEEQDEQDIGLIIHDRFNMMGEVASLSNTPIASLKTIGAITNVADTSYKFTASGSTDTGSKTGDLDFNGVAYEVWKQTASTCTLYSFAFIAQAYTGESPENYLKTSSGAFINKNGEGQGGNDYWLQGAGVMWDMFDKVGISGQYYFPGDSSVAENVSKALDEGKPVYFYGNLRASGNYHAVVLLGAADGGKVAYYNPGPGTVETYGSSSSFAANLESLLSNHFKHRLFIPDEVPTGVKKQTISNPYEGYKGNEAVVSPVTGILMEYGTYDAEDAQENRENIDLKYGGLLEGKEYKTQEVTTTDPLTGEETTTTEILYPYDKVGYAVIKVLDAETYQKLESTVDNKWQNDSLLKISEKAENDKLEVQADGSVEGTIKANTHISFREVAEVELDEEERNWSTVDETVYGYKEFVESYESFGIAGYYIYIDGFKCEGVGETAEDDDKDRSPQITTPGDPLTLDSFKVTESELLDENHEFKTESKYEPDEVSKMISESYYNKIKAEADIKETASIGITFDYTDTVDGVNETNEYILIKEGTVLGRTLTDEEVVTEREGNYGTYDEYLEAQKGNDSDEDIEKTDNKLDSLLIEPVPLMGNYLRIIMQDEDGDIVENVEDYMKLDEGEKKNTDNDWELFFWLPFESGGTDQDGCGPESQGTCSSGETAVGIIQWTVLTSSNMNNIASQFIPGCLEEDSSLCAPLIAYQSWSANDFWNDYCGSKQFQATLSRICDTDRDAFLHCQMEVAKKQYLDPILEEYPWLADRPSCVQGAVMHLKVWGASYSWIGSYQSSSDEEIVKKVRNTIANTGSTAGAATGDESSGRAYNEPQIALEILSGAMSADDVEQWVRTKDVSYLSFSWKN